MIREVQSKTPSGFAMLALTVLVFCAAIWGIVPAANTGTLYS